MALYTVWVTEQAPGHAAKPNHPAPSFTRPGIIETVLCDHDSRSWCVPASTNLRLTR